MAAISAMAEHQGVRVAIAEMAAISACGTIAGLLYLARKRRGRRATVAPPLVGEPASASVGPQLPTP
jgi:hypothetical protein